MYNEYILTYPLQTQVTEKNQIQKRVMLTSAMRGLVKYIKILKLLKGLNTPFSSKNFYICSLNK
jgi:hypothetical protein